MKSTPWVSALLVLAGFCVIAVASSAGPAKSRLRPNFVVVLADDLRWDSLEASGHPFIRNPSIDRLSKEGVRFRNAFVTTPLCSPSRASFLTGRYARAHEVRTNNDPDDFSHRFVTFPALLEGAGYDTAFIGKWHMGEDDTPRPGFRHWVAFAGQGPYKNPTLNINGRREKILGYTTDVLTHYALDFVRTAAQGNRPFLLYLSHKAVHEPFRPPSRHENLYANEKVPCSPGCYDRLRSKPAVTRAVPGTMPPLPGDGPTDDEIRNQMALLAAIDDGLGEILEVLQEERALDETAVVFASDNGFFHREHGLSDKRWAYEESIRVPLIVRYPRLARAGTCIDSMVLNVDLAPTLLELGGLPAPEEMHGTSFVPLLLGDTSGWRSAFAAEYFEEASSQRIPTWEAIRTERFKYIRYARLGPEFDELYDLRSDPYELQNRIDEPELASLRESLRRELERLLTFP
jgi:N-acetylglucosamine-6-sulfatase